jgi:molybdopterin synthase catalytic subunit
MAYTVCEVLLTEEPLVGLTEASPVETGAIVDFWGIVRPTEDGVAITGIDYEAHAPMAEHQLRMVVADAAQQFNVLRVTIHHRIGFVAESEASLLVRVESRHRAAAFEAGEWIITELKRRVPIWKRPRSSVSAQKDEMELDSSSAAFVSSEAA